MTIWTFARVSLTGLRSEDRLLLDKLNPMMYASPPLSYELQNHLLNEGEHGA